MRAAIAAALIGLLSCAGPSRRAVGAGPMLAAVENPRLANLRRAAQYPWTDEGACAAREAAGEWRTLIERCHGALELSRIRFRDIEHRCPVAQADAMTLQATVGFCLLVQPELAGGAIIVIGVVVVASAIAAEIAKETARARSDNPPVPKNPNCEIIYGACVDAAGKGALTIEACDNCRRFCEKEGWWDPRICGFSPVTHQAR